jgi:hypothetical protein
VVVNAQWIQDRIDEVRGYIGRNVTFHVPSLTPCTLCVASGYYDPVNDITTFFTCPICAGQYYLPTTTTTEVLARIHWTSDEAITATPGGKFYTGDANIHISPDYLSLAESTQTEKGKVVIDGHDMTILKIIPQGAPTINRYRLILKGDGQRPE